MYINKLVVARIYLLRAVVCSILLISSGKYLKSFLFYAIVRFTKVITRERMIQNSQDIVTIKFVLDIFIKRIYKNYLSLSMQSPYQHHL